MELSDILLAAILVVLIRGQLIGSEWLKSQRRNTRRRFRAWRERRRA